MIGIKSRLFAGAVRKKQIGKDYETALGGKENNRK
jgi:hypothetical protein